jgi:hypothetical protein
MKTRGSITGMLALAAVTFGLFSCMSLKTIDEMGGQPKGYVSFYSPSLEIDIYRLENKDKMLEAENHDFWQSYPELRIAKSPGSYTFRVTHKDYAADLRVEVQPDMVSYVSVNEIVLYWTSSTSQNFGRVYGGGTTTTTRWTYVVSTTVGDVALPVSPGPGDTEKILKALDDGDWGTRLFAVASLRQAKLDPGPDGTAKLKDMASSDRKREVREAAADLLKSMGAALPGTPLFLETFDDNARDWLYSDEGDPLQCYFTGLGYNMDNATGNYTWNTIPSPDRLTNLEDYDVEVEAVWKDGIQNNAFGILLGNSARDFYDFCVSRNGGAISHRVVDAGVKSKPIDWNNEHGTELAAGDSFSLKVEVRGDSAAYSANGFPIGTVSLEEGFLPYRIGLIVYYNQDVLFRTIRITVR